MPDTTPTTELRAVIRAIYALKSPPPPGSQHYQAGWGTGLEAAIEAVQGVFEQPPAPARQVLGTTDQQPETTPDTELRDRIRRAICETSGQGHLWGTDMLEPDEFGWQADAVLAALPAPADRAAEVAELRDAVAGYRRTLAEADQRKQEYKQACIRLQAEVERLRADRAADTSNLAAGLRVAADEIAGIDFHPKARARSLDIATGLVRRLRRMADEAQQPETRCDVTFIGGGQCAKPEGHRPAGSQDPHVPEPAASQPDTETEAAPLAVGDRYESRTRVRTVTVTRLWVDEYGADAVAFEWRGGMSGAAHSVDMFHQLYHPAP